MTRDTILTRKGNEIKQECFRTIHLRNYQYQVQEMNDRWLIMVTDRSGEEAKHEAIHSQDTQRCGYTWIQVWQLYMRTAEGVGSTMRAHGHCCKNW